LSVEISAALRDKLSQYDTPTVCNAIEVVAPERKGNGFTTEQLVCARPELGAMVGIARTAMIRATNPTDVPADKMKERRLAYYTYVAAKDAPTITVIQDLDPNPGFGAFWGEVNSNIHMGLGCVGCVTNGSFRDLDELADGFQILGGKVGPSHAYIHLVDFNVQVNIYGMTVSDGDLIHADKHGAVAIPPAIASNLPDAIDLVIKREAPILAACRAPDFDIEKLNQAMADAAEIH
jgi:regulator of RNase E activity RraA